MGGNNTEDGMIAIFKPAVDATHETIHEKFYPNQFANSIMWHRRSTSRRTINTDAGSGKSEVDRVPQVRRRRKGHKVWSPAAEEGTQGVGELT